MRVCLHARTHTYMGGGGTESQLQGHPSGSVPAPPPPPAGYLTGPGPHRTGYTGWLARPRDLLVPSRRITSRDHHPWLFHMGVWESNSDGAFVAATTFKLSDPSLQESTFSLHLPCALSLRLCRSGGGRSTEEHVSHFVAVEAYILLHLAPQFPRVSITSTGSSCFKTIITTGQR